MHVLHREERSRPHRKSVSTGRDASVQTPPRGTDTAVECCSGVSNVVTDHHHDVADLRGRQKVRRRHELLPEIPPLRLDVDHRPLEHHSKSVALRRALGEFSCRLYRQIVETARTG